MTLNNKQKAFVNEYVRDFNASRAALAVGYSPKTAYSIGQENLKKPEIADAIRAHIDNIAMSADEVKTRLADIARGDMADFMDITPYGWEVQLTREGKPIPQTKIIKKIKQRVTTRLSKTPGGDDFETVETEIELYSAHDALRDIGKMHAMFTDKQEQSGEMIIRVVYDGDSDQDEELLP